MARRVDGGGEWDDDHDERKQPCSRVYMPRTPGNKDAARTAMSAGPGAPGDGTAADAAGMAKQGREVHVGGTYPRERSPRGWRSRRSLRTPRTFRLAPYRLLFQASFAGAENGPRRLVTRLIES